PFRKNIEPRCAYCARGSQINDEEVACVKRGIVAAEHHCGSFRYDDEVVRYLTHKSYSAVYGARNLRRTIQKELEDEMARCIIDSYDAPVTQLRAVMREEKLVIESL
ncbi:MAG: hypothetical protein IIV78_03650, partial [Oscillospiraceae bacterium]|nr:hypothetical protein [Oscillospiraceae bacterium]